MSMLQVLERLAETNILMIQEVRKMGAVDGTPLSAEPVREPIIENQKMEPIRDDPEPFIRKPVPVTPPTNIKTAPPISIPAEPIAPGPNVPIISGTLPMGAPGIRLDMSKAKPAARLEPIDNGGPAFDVQVPRGYVMAKVGTPGTGQYEGMQLNEHGAATLLADEDGMARYVLGCAHVPTVVDPDTGEFTSIANEYTLSIRPAQRSKQPLIYSCDEVYVHPYYEGTLGTYRWDLSLSVLPEPVNIAHAISRYDMSMHRVDAGEQLTYCGMGSVEENGMLHDKLHFGVMKATGRSRNHIAELVPVDDEFEQGFSGGPMYSRQQQMAWSGVISHYVKDIGGPRKSYIIPASAALPWADQMITWLRSQ